MQAPVRIEVFGGVVGYLLVAAVMTSDVLPTGLLGLVGSAVLSILAIATGATVAAKSHSRQLRQTNRRSVRDDAKT